MKFDPLALQAERRILLIRQHRVMLDYVLATLYGVEARALNQAVKQQNWIIQDQQRSRETPPQSESRLTSVVIPETKINGVVQNAHVEYLRIEP